MFGSLMIAQTAHCTKIMTDRELLNSIEAQIKAHKEDAQPAPLPPPPDTGPKIIPAPGHFRPPKGDFTGWVWPMPTWEGETVGLVRSKAITSVGVVT